MGCRILHDTAAELACLYCSTSDVSFGPVFNNGDDGDHDAAERAEAFCRWLIADPRTLSEPTLMAKYGEWLTQEAAQWKREAGCEACGEPCGEGSALCPACQESR